MTTVADALRQAITFHRAGRMDEAERVYRTILAADRFHDEALNLLGVLCHQTGRNEEAVTLLKQAIDRRKRTPEYHSHLGMALEAMGRTAEAEQAHRRAVTLAPENPSMVNNLGVQVLNSGRPAEALPLFEKAAQLKPDYADAHNNVGLARQRTGNLRAAIPSYERAVQLAPNHPIFLNNFATALQEGGQLPQAEQLLRRVLEIDPDYAEAYNNLGLVLKLQGRTEEALAVFETALRLRPRFADALHNRAHTLHSARRTDAAVESYKAALALEPGHIRSNLDLANLLRERGDVDGAAHRYWTVLQHQPRNPEARAGFAASAPYARDREAWPVDALAALVLDLLVAEEIGGGQLFPMAHMVLRRRPAYVGLTSSANVVDLEALGREPVFMALLPRALAPDLEFERKVAALRTGLLGHLGTEDARRFLPLACALAAHIAVAEYVHSETLDEAAAISALDARLAEAPLDALAVAVYAMYRPIVDRPWVGRVRNTDAPWPAPLEALLTQVVDEPLAERTIEAGLPQRTPIADAVSQRVRAQYEENPYPRWRLLAAPLPRAWNDGFRIRLPWLDDVHLPRGDRVLVAGCGTGQEPLRLAAVHPELKIDAIDLSRRSLGYAARKAAEMRLSGRVTFAQADLLALGDAQAMGLYDRVYCSGVLHHLANPLDGLKAVTARLAPGGIIHLGLYSRLARRRLNVVREWARAGGFESNITGIRAMRQGILANLSQSEFADVTQWRDFYSTSDCRDLVLHVQEHQYDILQVGELLDAAGLDFLAFDFEDPRVEPRFRQEATDAGELPEAALRSLEAWHDFEERNPDTFRHMYQFYAQKPG